MRMQPKSLRSQLTATWSSCSTVRSLSAHRGVFLGVFDRRHSYPDRLHSFSGDCNINLKDRRFSWLSLQKTLTLSLGSLFPLPPNRHLILDPYLSFPSISSLLFSLLPFLCIPFPSLLFPFLFSTSVQLCLVEGVNEFPGIQSVENETCWFSLLPELHGQRSAAREQTQIYAFSSPTRMDSCSPVRRKCPPILIKMAKL